MLADDPSGVSGLAHQLYEGKTVELRVQAAKELGSIGTPAAVQALADGLTDEYRFSGGLSYTIAEQLASIGEPAVPALTALTGDHGGARPYAIEALEHIQGIRNIRTSVVETAVEAPPSRPAAGPMVLGIVLLVIGIVICLVALNMDATVTTERENIGGIEIPSQTVNNIGLMDQRRNILIVGGLVMVVGVVLAAVGGLQRSSPAEALVEDAVPLSDPDTKKCPYCAEDIKAQAIVCRYCGRDVPVSGP